MQIRKCEISDIENVANFYDEVIIYLDNHINYPKWEYRIYPSIISVRAMAMEGYQYIAFDDNDNIIASFVLNKDPEGSYHKAKWGKDIDDFMVIHAFAVRPNLEHKGYGTKILKFCIDMAKKQGMGGIRLDVVPTNYPAKAFYEKNGFKYVCDIDLDRNIDRVPVFSLYELYF